MLCFWVFLMFYVVINKIGTDICEKYFVGSGYFFGINFLLESVFLFYVYIV